jgi:hypothetical protein
MRYAIPMRTISVGARLAREGDIKTYKKSQPHRTAILDQAI